MGRKMNAGNALKKLRRRYQSREIAEELRERKNNSVWKNSKRYITLV
jgi:hypothetical protein